MKNIRKTFVIKQKQIPRNEKSNYIRLSNQNLPLSLWTKTNKEKDEFESPLEMEGRLEGDGKAKQEMKSE